MKWIKNIINYLPEVKGPTQKKLEFKEKLKWSLIILVAFFVLSLIPLYGLGQNALEQFEQLAIIIGASFGSIISLGIGPIVTASIVLQLLNGSGLVKFDLTSQEGKKNFQGFQKILAVFFVIFEAAIYVFMGGLAPAQTLAPNTFFIMELLLVFQLTLGGLLIIFMAEVIDKWGFGQGISLFILAGVGQQIVIRALSPLSQSGNFALFTQEAPVGALWTIILGIPAGNTQGAILAISAILATILVFLFSVYAQGMKVEIPLSFGKIRGYGIRWPLSFIYTSNIPVILIAALMANVQLWAKLLESWGKPVLGTFSGNVPASGLVFWLNAPDLLGNLLTGNFPPVIILQAITYAFFLIGGSVIFSIFWVQTSGMDARSQADQILASGLSIPGFRRDPRVLERILNRYIFPLTIMGGATVGLLAATADVLGALSRGTGILLAVMIAYKLYE